MLAKLALAYFLMVNGSPVGPLGVAIVNDPFPTEQACQDYVATEAGQALKAHAEEWGKAYFHDDAVVVVPECVVLDSPPAVTPKGERGASTETIITPGGGTGGATAEIPFWGAVS